MTHLPDLILSAHADGTKRKYLPHWKKWATWANHFEEVKILPAEPFFVALYISQLVAEGASLNSVITIFCAIRWMHQFHDLSSPTDSKFVKLALEGAKRKLAVNKANNQKDPIEPEHIKEIAEKFELSENILDIRFVVLCLLGFSGFLRISELLEIQVKHIIFEENCVKITIEKSKTDQLREGHIIFISKTGNKTCPVTWLLKYLELSGLYAQPDSYIFCKFVSTKTGHIAKGNHPITYDTARKTFQRYVSCIPNIDPKKFGLHSLRSGGASAAARYGVTDRMIRKHGRWSTISSRDRYIKDSAKARLGVSQNLGL